MGMWMLRRISRFFIDKAMVNEETGDVAGRFLVHI